MTLIVLFCFRRLFIQFTYIIHIIKRTVTGIYFKIKSHAAWLFFCVFSSLCELECAVYDGVETVIQRPISAWLKTWFYFFLCQSYSEILAVMWARLAFPPIREAIWLKAVCDCVVNSSKYPSIPRRLHTPPCPQDLHSLYLTVSDPAALSNEYQSNRPPPSISLFFSLRQTVAGRMLRPPHQWLHPQKDPEAFTLTPPTDPPPPSPTPRPLLPNFLRHCIPSHISQNLSSNPIGTGHDCTVCSYTAGHSWGLGWHFHHYGQIFHFSYLDHRCTVSSLRRGLISTRHSLYSFHSMSMLPLCISLTLYIHTVGTQIAA